MLIEKKPPVASQRPWREAREKPEILPVHGLEA
jgi:hypothetical protein